MEGDALKKIFGIDPIMQEQAEKKNLMFELTNTLPAPFELGIHLRPTDMELHIRPTYPSTTMRLNGGRHAKHVYDVQQLPS